MMKNKTILEKKKIGVDYRNMDKSEIATVFEEIASLLELQGANPFRVRAYRNAARSLMNSDKSVKELLAEGALTKLAGIGDDLAEKITTLASKKRLPFYEKLKKSTPKGILKLIQVHGLGPKKVKEIYRKLRVQTIEELKRACKAGRIAKLKGFGAKTEKNILEAISEARGYAKRELWLTAYNDALPLLEELRAFKGVKKAELAGSLRRRLETVGDFDLVAASPDPERVTKWFAAKGFVAKVLGLGPTMCSVKLKSGVQVDLRVVKEDLFGFALLHFTGSKEHNVKIRNLAKKLGWSLSEYGFEALKKGRPPVLKKNAGEEEIYEALGLSYIEPEMREDRGEIEAAAAAGKLPHLIEVGDIRGTLHNHTTESDGRNSLIEMVAGAEKMGWEYFGISDHSKSSFQANGLSEERLYKQIEEIKKLNESKKFKVHVLCGTECDILADGSLDFSSGVLKKLGFVIASIHSSMSQDEKTMTKRIIKAIEHPHMTILGHATGRLLLKREGYRVDLEKVIDACIANKKIIEINGSPQRLDMDWRYWHAARDKGLLCCINTDAHAVSHHEFIQCAVFVARKGWLEKGDVLNTRSLRELLKYLG
jgi:DNA polymerase (family 10)